MPSSTILCMTGILRSMLSISAATVISRATGFARVATLAAFLGTGIIADAYAVAVFLPNIIYELFLGGIMYSIFIPILVDRLTSHGEQDARDLTNALFTIAVPLLATVAFLGVVFAEPLVTAATAWTQAERLSPAEAQETTETAILLFRIFAVQMVFFGISTIATGVLQAHRRFFLTTLTPVMYNLSVIVSFFAYAILKDRESDLAIYALAAGATVGAVLMSSLLIPTMLRLGYKPTPKFGHPALAHAARLAMPMLVLVASSVGVQFSANYLASSFGAVALIGYAFTIFTLPYGIFVVAVATALMPELSEKYSRGDVEGYRDTLSFGLRLVAFVAVPATVGLITLARPIVGMLYERGEFDAQATETVSWLLTAYAVGLLGYGAYFFIVRAFYSRQNTKTPALTNVILLIFYVVLAYIFKEAFGLIGVALALSVTNAILALVAIGMMRRAVKRIGGHTLLVSFSKVLVAGLAMYAVAWGGTSLLGTGSGTVERAAIVTVVGSVSLAAYLGAAFLLRAEEVRWVASLLRRKIERTEA